MTDARYFECQTCSQVVQGWHAAHEWIQCCSRPHYHEVPGPQEEPERFWCAYCGTEYDGHHDCPNPRL